MKGKPSVGKVLCSSGGKGRGVGGCSEAMLHDFHRVLKNISRSAGGTRETHVLSRHAQVLRLKKGEHNKLLCRAGERAECAQVD